MKARKRLLALLLGLLALGPAAGRPLSATGASDDGADMAVLTAGEGDLPQLPEAAMLAIFGVGLTVAARAARRRLQAKAPSAE